MHAHTIAEKIHTAILTTSRACIAVSYTLGRKWVTFVLTTRFYDVNSPRRPVPAQKDESVMANDTIRVAVAFGAWAGIIGPRSRCVE